MERGALVFGQGLRFCRFGEPVVFPSLTFLLLFAQEEKKMWLEQRQAVQAGAYGEP